MGILIGVWSTIVLSVGEDVLNVFPLPVAASTWQPFKTPTACLRKKLLMAKTRSKIYGLFKVYLNLEVENMVKSETIRCTFHYQYGSSYYMSILSLICSNSYGAIYFSIRR